MMDGVTILNEIEVVTTVNDTCNYIAAGTAIIITVIVCGIIGFIIGRTTSNARWSGCATGLVIGIVLSISTGTLFGCICSYPPETETYTRYEMIVDDSVSMNEFYKRYNIIEQRGTIYVIEEKNINN